MKKITVLVFLLLFAVAAQADVIDKVAAIVDDEIILDSEVFQYLQLNVGSQARLDSLSPAQLDTLKKQVLEELIKQKVLLAKARSDTVKIEPRDVDRELDNRMKTLMDQVGGQEKLEAYYNMPLAKIKRQFRQIVEEQMMIDRVKSEQIKKIKITRPEVDRWWQTYRDSIPPLKDAIRISHILLQDELSADSKEAAIRKADSARAMIVSGKISFEEYASKYSDDDKTASNGGKLGITNRGDLVPEYEAAAFALKEGEISQPVVSPFGVHLIRLNERTGEKINTDHILFKIVPAEEDKARTMARADSICKALRGGADFAALADEYSTDAKSAVKGGDLGWFSPQEMPDDFREPIKSLKPGDISDPFRTRFGVHIVKMVDRVYARAVTMEEDYDRIEQLALRMKQDKDFDGWVKDLEKTTYIERK